MKHYIQRQEDLARDQGLRARDAFRRLLLTADRLPTHIAHVQFGHPLTAQDALLRARHVDNGFGQAAGQAVPYLTVAEPNASGLTHHLHALYWSPTILFGHLITKRWERRARSVHVPYLHDDPRLPAAQALSAPRRLREASRAACPDAAWPVCDAVTYVTKWFHHDDVDYDLSPDLLARIGAQRGPRRRAA